MAQTGSQIGSRIFGSVAETSASELVSTFTGHFVNEYSGINVSLAAILEKTPEEVPYLGVRRLFVYPIIFVPARLLLDKEPLEIGKYVNVNYLNGSALSSFPPTQPGDLFLSGGWPALVLGELAIGGILGLLWRTTGSKPYPRRWVLYGLLAPLFTNAGLDFGTLMRQGFRRRCCTRSCFISHSE